MNVSLQFAWYDLWVGAFIDVPKRKLYVFLVPCIGVVFDWAKRGVENYPDDAPLITPATNTRTVSRFKPMKVETVKGTKAEIEMGSVTCPRCSGVEKRRMFWVCSRCGFAPHLDGAK